MWIRQLPKKMEKKILRPYKRIIILLWIKQRTIPHCLLEPLIFTSRTLHRLGFCLSITSPLSKYQRRYSASALIRRVLWSLGKYLEGEYTTLRQKKNGNKEAGSPPSNPSATKKLSKRSDEAVDLVR